MPCFGGLQKHGIPLSHSALEKISPCWVRSEKTQNRNTVLISDQKTNRALPRGHWQDLNPEPGDPARFFFFFFFQQGSSEPVAAPAKGTSAPRERVTQSLTIQAGPA